MKETCKKTVFITKIALLSILVFSLSYLIYYVFFKYNGGVTDVDQKVIDFILNIRNDNYTKINKFLTMLGREFLILKAVCFIILGFIIYAIKKYKNKKYYLVNIFFPGIASLSAMFLNFALKNIGDRVRPDILHLVNETSFSFPSSHSTCSVVFYFSTLIVIINIIDRYIKNTNNKRNDILLKILKIFLIITISIVPFIVAYTRVYLGVHYFTDVCAGLMFGGILFIIFNFIYNKLIEN